MFNRKIKRVNIYSLILVTLLAVLLGGYSFDLKQENPESIFLTNKGLKLYNNFNHEFGINEKLIFKVKYKNKLSKDIYDDFVAKTDHLKNKYNQEFDFILPSDFFNSFEKLEAGLKQIKSQKKTIELSGDDFLALLVIVKDKKFSFKPIFADLKKSFQTNEIVEKLRFAGTPFTNILLDEYSNDIKKKLFPTIFIFSFLLIIVLTKSFLTGLILFLPCLFAVLSSLSFIKYFYENMNMITSIIPLLCFTIILAVVFHLFYTIRHEGSFERAWMVKKKPIFLMILTTCIGFGSLVLAEIQVIRDFGILCVFLILFNSLISILWMGKMANLISAKKDQRKKDDYLGKFFEKSYSSRKIFLISLGALLIGTYALIHLSVVTNAIEYFPKKNSVKENIINVAQTVVGIPLYEIVIWLERKVDRKMLIDLEQTEQKLLNLLSEENKMFGLISINSMVRDTNQVYSGERKTPDHMIAYQVLRSKLGQKSNKTYPLANYYRITINGGPTNIDEYERGLEIINNYLISRGMKFEVNGLYYNLMVAQKAMIGVLFRSFFFALFIVSTIAFLYYKELKIFLIFIFINTIPVFISFIFLKLLNFSLNIATIMTYPIALGLIVDSTFHIIHHLKNSKKTNYESYISSTILPIVTSSILLMTCFLIFGFNNFLPIKQFGVNLSIILGLGLIFDLYVLPTLYFNGISNIKNQYRH